MRRNRGCLTVLWLLVAALTTGDLAAQQMVTRVIDGDTFELSDGSRVRLIGIDTPEKFGGSKLNRDAARTGQDRATIQALGERASAFAAALVEGRLVGIEYDQANAANDHRDRYGRILGYLWLIEEGERTTLINLHMVRSGFATVYTQYPFRYANAFRQAEAVARETRAGLWADDLVPASAPPSRTPPSTGADRDCAHFSSQREAQQFFEAAGPGDPHRLDADRDGFACESLAR